mgnify:CR=1 FL=1
MPVLQKSDRPLNPETNPETRFFQKTGFLNQECRAISAYRVDLLPSGRSVQVEAGTLVADAIAEAGAEPWFFDDHGYEDGYFEATLPAGSAAASSAIAAAISLSVTSFRISEAEVASTTVRGAATPRRRRSSWTASGFTRRGCSSAWTGRSSGF